MNEKAAPAQKARLLPLLLFAVFFAIWIGTGLYVIIVGDDYEVNVVDAEFTFLPEPKYVCLGMNQRGSRISWKTLMFKDEPLEMDILLTTHQKGFGWNLTAAICLGFIVILTYILSIQLLRRCNKFWVFTVVGITCIAIVVFEVWRLRNTFNHICITLVIFAVISILYNCMTIVNLRKFDTDQIVETVEDTYRVVMFHPSAIIISVLIVLGLLYPLKYFNYLVFANLPKAKFFHQRFQGFSSSVFYLNYFGGVWTQVLVYALWYIIVGSAFISWYKVDDKSQLTAKYIRSNVKANLCANCGLAVTTSFFISLLVALPLTIINKLYCYDYFITLEVLLPFFQAILAVSLLEGTGLWKSLEFTIELLKRAAFNCLTLYWTTAIIAITVLIPSTLIAGTVLIGLIGECTTSVLYFGALAGAAELMAYLLVSAATSMTICHLHDNLAPCIA